MVQSEYFATMKQLFDFMDTVEGKSVIYDYGYAKDGEPGKFFIVYRRCEPKKERKGA